MRSTFRRLCCVLLLSYVSVILATKERQPVLQKVSLTISPKRIHVYETSVRITLRYSSSNQGNITQMISIRTLDQNNREVRNFNDSINLLENNRSFELPCETFSRPGKYHFEYYVQGFSSSYRKLRNSIYVRNGKEKIHIDIPNNHTALSRSLSVLITRKRSICQPYNDKLQLYWIKSINNLVLVHTKKIKDTQKAKQTFVKYGCNILDTQGIFYFEYISGESGRRLARSKNISILWGKYELNPQSKSIFPCSTTFAVKFTSPYCAKTEDKVEIRSKIYNNFIASQSAYPGFRSVFFNCEIFKNYIHKYCFYYITKSSLTNTEKVQAQSCIPFQSTVSQLSGWSAWSNWGLCSSPNDCGLGRKYRLRSCQDSGIYEGSKQSACNGSPMEHTSCYLSPCQGTDCCGCVFTSPGGTIVSPEWLPTPSRNKTNCHWLINVAPNKKVKLWFDTLKLSKDSTIHIIDGNASNSKVLQLITDSTGKNIGDILSSSNVITIRYYFKQGFNKTNSGFQLSYSSVDSTLTNFHSPSSSPSKKKQLVKKAFIGLLAIIIVMIFFGVICKLRRKPRNPQSRTKLNKPATSSHTSSACMSDSTLRSIYELGVSGDECANNNFSYPRVQQNSSRPRVSGPIRINNRACAHICPKCCHYPEGTELLGSCQPEDNQRIVYSSYSHTVRDMRQTVRKNSYQTTSEESASDDYL